jgi:hypothetical protein
MTTDYVEEVLRAIDPAISDLTNVTQSHQDEIWQTIVASLVKDSPRNTQRTRHARRSWSIGALGASAVAAATLLVTLGSVPTSAVAATLKVAAAADTHAAVLPMLTSGQYYYQEAQVSLVCQFGSPNMAQGEPLLTYVANGTMQSWTATDGSGKVVITPSAIGAGGSHFATPADEARWIALGKPFIPCALSDSSNRLGGNPANANHQSAYGGFAATVSGYSGFGLSLASASQTSLLNATTSINNLPQSAAAISTLLTNGQIGADGSLSPSPQVCPVLDGSGSAALGCTPSEQLSILVQLLQLPDASAKLGSALYQVLENLPGAKLVGSVTTADGSAGTAVLVPSGANMAFQVVIDPTSGALLSCSELLTSNGVTSTIGLISYGPVQIAQGQGVAPAVANQL